MSTAVVLTYLGIILDIVKVFNMVWYAAHLSKLSSHRLQMVVDGGYSKLKSYGSPKLFYSAHSVRLWMITFPNLTRLRLVYPGFRSCFNTLLYSDYSRTFPNKQPSSALQMTITLMHFNAFFFYQIVFVPELKIKWTKMLSWSQTIKLRIWSDMLKLWTLMCLERPKTSSHTLNRRWSHCGAIADLTPFYRSYHGVVSWNCSHS